MTGELLREAEAAHARGWLLTPLAGKKPILTGWPDAPEPSLEEVRTWAREHNLGVRTGPSSGIIVLDVDTYAGGDPKALNLPPTWTARTGRGGLHYFFHHPATATRIGNSSGELAPHVDVKCSRGQVVLAGSRHPETGKAYQWETARSPDDLPLAELPPHILERLLPKPAPAPRAVQHAPTNGGIPAYARAALEGEVAAVRNAPEGERNETLNRAAFNLAQLGAGGVLPEHEIAEQLLAAALDVGLPEHEARTTIKSGLAAGGREPRGVPERRPQLPGNPARDLSDGDPQDRPQELPPLPAAEDLTAILSRPQPVTPWAVRKLIAEGDLGTISGPGGSFKTTLGLAMFVSLARGADLFDHYQTVRPYNVAVLDLESRPWEIDQRLCRICAGAGLAPDDLDGRVMVFRERLRLDVAADLDRLAAGLRAWGSSFLLVDSFRRCLGGDVNKSETTNAIFQAADRIRAETGCGVIWIDHHRKKTGERELDTADQALTGSNDKRNLVDFHVGVEDRDGRLAWIPDKSRHSRTLQPLALEIVGMGEHDYEDGPVSITVAGSLDRASDKVQDSCLALLEAPGGLGMLRGEIIGQSGYSARAVDAALAALLGRARIRREKTGKQVRYFTVPR